MTLLTFYVSKTNQAALISLIGGVRWHFNSHQWHIHECPHVTLIISEKCHRPVAFSEIKRWYKCVQYCVLSCCCYAVDSSALYRNITVMMSTNSSYAIFPCFAADEWIIRHLAFEEGPFTCFHLSVCKSFSLYTYYIWVYACLVRHSVHTHMCVCVYLLYVW